MRRIAVKKPITFAIAGLGSRGLDVYAAYQLDRPGDMSVTAAADISQERREKAVRLLGLPPERCFESAEAMLQQPKLADVMVIATQDRQHFAHAMPALEAGYDLLLEKPISPDMGECVALRDRAEALGRKVAVCHGLRYTRFYRAVYDLLRAGEIGELMSVHASENVGYWHQAHSFVRGNWRNSEETSPMILQKCCHDMDIYYWLIGAPCTSVSSFGSLGHFSEQHAPPGSAVRCTDDCAARKDCPYDAVRFYLTEGVAKGETGWPFNVPVRDPTEETMAAALRDGPYGRCVYRCDNNVVDHQSVVMLYENGVTASFSMCAFTNTVTRQLRLMGARGEIYGDMEQQELWLRRFGEEAQRIDVTPLNDSGHNGGDAKLMSDFIEYIRGERLPDTITGLRQSIHSHAVCHAAEHSRLNGGATVRVAGFSG
jgi:predicted dehydrogenase